MSEFAFKFSCALTLLHLSMAHSISSSEVVQVFCLSQLCFTCVTSISLLLYISIIAIEIRPNRSLFHNMGICFSSGGNGICRFKYCFQILPLDLIVWFWAACPRPYWFQSPTLFRHCFWHMERTLSALASTGYDLQHSCFPLSWSLLLVYSSHPAA